jgi:hypothetical protein
MSRCQAAVQGFVAALFRAQRSRRRKQQKGRQAIFVRRRNKLVGGTYDITLKAGLSGPYSSIKTRVFSSEQISIPEFG